MQQLVDYARNILGCTLEKKKIRNAHGLFYPVEKRIVWDGTVEALLHEIGHAVLEERKANAYLGETDREFLANLFVFFTAPAMNIDTSLASHWMDRLRFRDIPEVEQRAYIIMARQAAEVFLGHQALRLVIPA
jgi:hypothetical protein